MRKMKNQKRFILAFLLIFAAVALLGCSQGVEEKKQPATESGQQATVVQEEKKEEVPAELKAFTEYAVKKAVGEKTVEGKDRIRSISISEESGKKLLKIELNGNSNRFSDMIIRGFQMDSKRLFQQLSARQDFDKAVIIIYLEQDDVSGTKVEEAVFTIAMSQESIAQIDWDKIMLPEIEGKAEVYELHPALK